MTKTAAKLRFLLPEKKERKNEKGDIRFYAIIL